MMGKKRDFIRKIVGFKIRHHFGFGNGYPNCACFLQLKHLEIAFVPVLKM
jgi:hypothetical protein